MHATEHQYLASLSSGLLANHGIALSVADLFSWCGSEGVQSAKRYARVDAAVRKLLGPECYAFAESAARLDSVVAIIASNNYKAPPKGTCSLAHRIAKQWKAKRPV